MIQDESLCARCARLRRTCCQSTDIYVTLGDVDRIALSTGRDDFYEFRAPENPAYLDQDDDPLWRDCLFRVDHTRRVLRRAPNGDCIFLTACGCRLCLESRPLVCRLHPYQYDEHGIREELAEGCPKGLLPPGRGLLESLHMSLEQARAWHRQLYRELRLEKEPSCTLV